MIEKENGYVLLNIFKNKYLNYIENKWDNLEYLEEYCDKLIMLTVLAASNSATTSENIPEALSAIGHIQCRLFELAQEYSQFKAN